MTASEVVTEPDGQYFRFRKAIATRPQCVVCHGSKGEMPESVQAMLKVH